jgi:multidrug resistance efflux pump
VIAFLIIVYCAVVLVLFKVFHLKPRPYLIACLALVGVLMIGGVVVAWTQSAPLTGQLVTTQYVVQLVPYVKGQVKAVHAEANQPMKKGDLLLEIDPAPYQFAADQLEAQLKASKANVEQTQLRAGGGCECDEGQGRSHSGPSRGHRERAGRPRQGKSSR